MTERKLQFPAGFMWGTSTSSHQVEGNNTNNNWYAWEEEPGRIPEGHRSGLDCDWWGGRWAEDMDRAVAGGQNAHRLSIEWSRVQPAPDRWDESALDYSRQMIKGLVERGLTPMVTLHHFTHPLWISEIGGWESSETPKHLYEYARRVVSALKEHVNLWCTINEPNVIAAVGYLDGAMPPGVSDIGRAFTAIARAHVAAYQAVHEVQPDARAGLALAYRGMHPARP
ncbi:MAG: family 1 glycosylhydrolase [Anaerolineales bacterium]